MKKNQNNLILFFLGWKLSWLDMTN